MVSFISLFLGLVMGFQTVEVQVADGVAWVEIQLDGQNVATLEAPDWRDQIDFGPLLQPYELVAVSFDETGEELDRVSQWVNLPRQPAETTIVLERDEDRQRLLARVTWESLTGEEPSNVRAAFDGRPLDVQNPKSIPLPPHDPETLHFLRVELEFSALVSSTAEVTFGGAYADQVNTELTAIPVVPVGRKKVPPERQLSEGFLARGEPLRVAALEKGQVELLVVRDQGAWQQVRRIRRVAQTEAGMSQNVTDGFGTQRSQQWFRPDREGWSRWTFQFLWPVPHRQAQGTETYDLFSPSAKFVGSSGSLHGWATTVEQPPEWTGRQRLADAVAIAGVTLAGGNRRRAVLVILGDETEDASQATIAAVRGYLKALAVPLYVWSVGSAKSGDSAWGPTTDVSTPKLMSRASRKIFHELDAQRIVWLEGLHLPQQVTLSPSLEGVIAVAEGGPPGKK